MAWQISGEYFETCSCDFLCPCVSDLTARPTQGWCVVAFAHHIDQGRFDGVSLDGLNFAVIARTPGESMASGNWTVGLITDERASAEQQQAIVAIVSGQAGGPMAALSGLIGTFAGVEARPIRFEMDGMKRSVSIPARLDQALEGAAGANGNEPMYFDNVDHPANARLALARATRSHVHAFGIDWDNTSGKTNGHFAPFRWQG